uniref:GAG-pre-integrase domain-containing protein n=1 Tax=Triticum urartu TaxID=4572 RepID=A0A8R7R0D9_TRIUA
RACWDRYEEDDYEEKEVNVVTNGYGIDTNWYADTGATNHITGELDKLTIRDKYHGQDQVHTDLDTRRILLRGKCVGGLYPLISSSSSLSSNKQAFVAIKPSSAKWHSRLGHPSSVIVKLVLSRNKLPHVFESSIESVCDPCQQAKSHQLPYPISTSISTAP